MSAVFTLSDESYSEIIDIIYERTGRLPNMTMRIAWTKNITWEVELPLNRTKVKTRNGSENPEDDYEDRWVIEPGVDKTIHVKIKGTKFDNHSNGVLFQYRPKAALMAKDLNMLVQLIKTSNFAINIVKTQTQELVEKGDFRAEDIHAVRCSL